MFTISENLIVSSWQGHSARAGTAAVGAGNGGNRRDGERNRCFSGWREEETGGVDPKARHGIGCSMYFWGAASLALVVEQWWQTCDTLVKGDKPRHFG